MDAGESVNWEVHITCISDSATFSRVCSEIGVKPVHAHNIVGGRVVSSELLTQADGFGTKEEALLDMWAIAQKCRDAGLHVIREKVEIDPRHADAPLEDHARGEDYFEAHIRAVHPTGRRAEVLALRDELLGRGIVAWASYNTFKRVAEGSEVTMLTARSFTMGLPRFTQYAKEAYSYAGERLALRPLIIEWAIADNNTALDDVWTRVVADLVAAN